MEKIATIKGNIIAFIFGAFVYGALEILWRGYTHPSMLFLGGICMFIIFIFEKKLSEKTSIFIRCIFYAFIITALELCFGLVLNVLLRLDVWDYSNMPMNLFGQICLPFFALWYVLSFASCGICKGIRFVME